VIFIDDLSDKAVELLESGVFSGLTTNPTIIKRDRLGWGLKDSIIFLNSLPGLHFFQGGVRNLEWLEWLKIAVKNKEIEPGKFVIKLPWEPVECVGLINDIHALGFKICATAVYSVNQYYLAKILKIEYAAIYFDRIRRCNKNPFKLFNDLLKIRSSNKETPRILAASIKRVEDANDLIILGVDDITLPLKTAIEFLKGNFPMNDLEKFEKDFKW